MWIALTALTLTLSTPPSSPPPAPPPLFSPLAVGGGAALVVGTGLAAATGVGAAMLDHVLREPPAAGVAKHLSVDMGPALVGTAVLSGVVAVAGAIAMTVGIVTFDDEAAP